MFAFIFVSRNLGVQNLTDVSFLQWWTNSIKTEGEEIRKEHESQHLKRKGEL